MNRYLLEKLMGERDDRDRDRRDRRDRDSRRDRRDRDYDDDEYRSREDRRDEARGGSGGSRGGNRGGGSRGGSQGGNRSGGNRGGGNSRGGGRGGDRNYDDYDSDYDFEYNGDMHGKELEVRKKDLKQWGKEIENADGSRGAKFYKDDVLPIAEQHGIKFDKFTEEEFVATVNMMYADYCEAVRDMQVPNYQKPEPYVHLAKAFLCDKDFEGEPYEKLALYYYAIVEFEDE